MTHAERLIICAMAGNYLLTLFVLWRSGRRVAPSDPGPAPGACALGPAATEVERAPVAAPQALVQAAQAHAVILSPHTVNPNQRKPGEAIWG